MKVKAYMLGHRVKVKHPEIPEDVLVTLVDRYLVKDQLMYTASYNGSHYEEIPASDIEGGQMFDADKAMEKIKIGPYIKPYDYNEYIKQKRGDFHGFQ